jgi:hypothetical protein
VHNTNVGLIKTLGSGDAADLQSQFEDLLTAVWDAEANWRFDDRIDLAHRIEGSRP